jgi:hypothetical protein
VPGAAPALVRGKIGAQRSKARRGSVDIDWYRAAGVALIVGVVGPIFWLGVNSFENWLKRSINERKAKKSAAPDSRFLK